MGLKGRWKLLREVPNPIEALEQAHLTNLLELDGLGI
jgi:hypothetical protein